MGDTAEVAAPAVTRERICGARLVWRQFKFHHAFEVDLTAVLTAMIHTDETPRCPVVPLVWKHHKPESA
jgi:hypothetical protein